MFNKKRSKFDYDSETFNVVESFSKAGALYKELILIVHPDKNQDKVELATNLTNLVNEHRYNYAALCELKRRINNEFFSPNDHI